MANAGPANYLPITEGGTKAVNTAAAYKIASTQLLVLHQVNGIGRVYAGVIHV